MNWYKKSQQEYFGFYNNISKQKPVQKEEGEEYQRLVKRTPALIQSLISQCQDLNEAVKVLKVYQFKVKIINDIAAVKIDGQPYIVDEMLNLKDPYDWIWTVPSHRLDEYVTYPLFNEKFWQNPVEVYHATTPEYLPHIQTNGLKPMDKSRGIENKGTGPAIFTSENPDELESYGDVLLRIDTLKMKQDGYMPEVDQELPVTEANKRDALANIIGMDDFQTEVEQGISPYTIVFYGNIPPKYISVIDRGAA